MNNQAQSLLDYIKSHYKLPLTAKDERRLLQFLDDISEKNEESVVHTTLVGSLESYEAEFTLMREIRIKRTSEYAYQEDLVFSLQPITPGIISKTVILTNPSRPMRDHYEYPEAILPNDMTYNVAIIRSIERYVKQEHQMQFSTSDPITKRDIMISYDILIYNSELDMGADGVFFEDIPEEEEID